VKKDLRKFISKKTSVPSDDVRSLIGQNLPSSLRVVLLMIITVGIAYPLLLVLIGEVTLPFQSTGSMLTLDGEVVGSKLIAQEFKSDKLFHIRPPANSTSTVDPHISPDDAYAQIPRISKATGLPESTLKTAIQLNIEKR
jgi:K+-transporting ATPase ATPase C chain